MLRLYYIIFSFAILCQISTLNAQDKYITRSGTIVFFSKAPIEDIKASNNQVSCIYETKSNRIIATVIIKAFTFEKALMQEHFNENYMESDKFPKATFKGKLLDIQNVNFSSVWTKNIIFEGDLTMHGITKKIKNPASISCDGKSLTVTTEFYIFIKDYGIKIPSTLFKNIAEKVNIKMSLKLNELKN